MIFKNMGVKTKIIAGICVPLLAILVLGGYLCTRSIKSLIETGEWVEHTHTVIGEAVKITASAVDMETGMRGYLLAGKEEFLRPYREGEKTAYEKIRYLQKKVGDNAKQVTRLRDIEKIVREWQKKVVEPNIVLRRKISDALTMNDMAERVGKARGKTYFDKLRSQTDTFISRESSFIIERKQLGNTTKAASVANLATMKEARQWADHTYKVIINAKRILGHAVDMETGMRGFLLAGEEKFLEPYHTGKNIFLMKFMNYRKPWKTIRNR